MSNSLINPWKLRNKILLLSLRINKMTHKLLKFPAPPRADTREISIARSVMWLVESNMEP